MSFLKPIVAAALLATVFLQSAVAEGDESRLSGLMDQLRTADAAEAAKIESEILLEWQKSGSASADLLFGRGQDAMERGDFAAAIGHYTALVDHAPEFAEGWVARAEAYFAAGLMGPAVLDLETALALNPQHFEAIFGLGALFEVINRPKEALEAYEQVKAIHPHHPDLPEVLQRLEPLVRGQQL